MNKRWAWRLTLCTLLVLVALWVFWNTFWAGNHYATVPVMVAATTLPLLVALPGLLHHQRGSFIWLGLMGIFYCVHGIVSLYAQSSPHPNLAIIETADSFLLFLGAFFQLRCPYSINPTNATILPTSPKTGL